MDILIKKLIKNINQQQSPACSFAKIIEDLFFEFECTNSNEEVIHAFAQSIDFLQDTNFIIKTCLQRVIYTDDGEFLLKLAAEKLNKNCSQGGN